MKNSIQRYVMKVMLCGVALFLLSLATLADDKKTESFDGTWVPTKSTMDGQPALEDFLKSIKLTVKGNKYEISVDGDIQKGTMTFDKSTTPKRLKIEVREGKDLGMTYHCIYEFKDDEWTICSKVGSKYPKDFNSVEALQKLLISYKKAK